MLLRSIRFKNFRQYKGDQSIEFSCDPERNVTVILGDNTSGKTTIVQAFTWVLYGSANFSSEDLLNLDVASQMRVGDKEKVEVDICLNHDNTEYIISRYEEYVCTGNGIHRHQFSSPKLFYKQPDGQLKTIEKVDSTIQKILPKELSNYFFFDGERIETISSKQDVTEAVKGLLGLTVLSNAMSHLNPRSSKSVIGKFRSSMDVDSSRKAENLLQQIESLTDRREYIGTELANVEDQIKHYEGQIELTENILREHQPTAILQRKREELERNIKQEKTALEDSKKRLFDGFNRNAIGFFTQPMMKKALECLDDAKVSDKGIPDMNASAIDYIIQRGICICGEVIEEGSSRHAHLIKERDYLPPQFIGTVIRTFKEKISMYQSFSEPYYENLKSSYQEIIRCKTRINDWDDELLDICDRIKGKEDVKKHEENLQDYKNRLRKLASEKDKLIEENAKLVGEIERLQRLHDSLAIASEKNTRIQSYIRYAEAIYEWIKTTYESRQHEIRQQLETRVNNIFAQMYHGSRKVTINEKFNVTLLTALGEEEIVTDESRGLETVKNFAFIAGLVDLAKAKIKEKTEDLEKPLSSEPYPLVMDAPFSNAEEKHVTNISRILPDIAEQVIMVVMAKDWGFAETVMGHRVGKKYYLDKKSETLTYIKESV